ncbi:MAG: 50S ribosomal protein L11 methyltransferase [Tissierellia bacterium]|nr:50S ribosomal protein L11 methyltransferase [Tissierellia bacterium]
MIYQKIQWTISRRDVELVIAVLDGQGIDTLEISDDKDISDYYNEKEEWIIMDPFDDYGDEIKLSFYLDGKEKFFTPKILENKIIAEEIKTIDDQDYLYQWQKYYEPIEIGDLLVLPSWEERVSDKTVIKIDPGMAFGTGDHETTKACLDLIQGLDLSGKSVLDIGTGSGILAFACDKFGAQYVKGIDIDPVAIEQAKANQQLNNTQVTFVEGDLVKDVEEKFDILLGNLLSHIIIKMLPDLPSRLKKDHSIILSGILCSEEMEMEQALEKENYEIIDRRKNGQWLALKVRWNG